MATWKDQYKKNPDVDNNYCLKAWLEFTTLTDEELRNLKKLTKKQEIFTDSVIYCPELDITTKTMQEMSELTGISYPTIFKRLHGAEPVKDEYHFRRVYI